MDDIKESLWEKIAGKLHGELNSDEEAGFNELMSDNGHLTEFKRTEKIRDDLSKTGPAPYEAKNKSWNRVGNSIRWSRMHWISSTLKYAALVVVAFVSGILLHTNTPVDSTLHYSKLYVPCGQMGQITMSDGTQVWLNSGTTLRYPDRFGDKSRSVEVKGEAFFKVAKIPDKPFTINSTDLTVEVLGTSFNFSAYQKDNYSSVTLVEGKVAIHNDQGETVAKLQPGQMATKDKNTGSLNIKEVNTTSYSEWIDGKIFFDDERLDQIALKLERWFNVEISFDDPSLKSKRFNGTILKNKPIDQIMQALELLAPIQFHHQINASGKDKITIYKRS